MTEPTFLVLCRQIGDTLLARGQWLVTAESCTGGLIAKLLTDVPGSSGWFERGLVVYSNRAKEELLAVPATLITQHGAVSGEVCAALLEGLMRSTPADHGIAVTGIAGPGGGSADKPVGTVWIGWIARGGAPCTVLHRFSGTREEIREAAARTALQGLMEAIGHGA